MYNQQQIVKNKTNPSASVNKSRTFSKTNLFLILLIIVFLIIFTVAAYSYFRQTLSSKLETANSTNTTTPSVINSNLSSQSDSTDDATANWKTYTNTTGKYSIKLPPDYGEWKLISTDPNPWTFATSIDTDKAMVLLGINHPLTTNTQGGINPPQTIQINFVQNMTLEQYWNEYTHSGFDQKIGTLGPYTVTIISGSESHSITYALERDNNLLMITNVNSSPEVDQIISTIKFTL